MNSRTPRQLAWDRFCRNRPAAGAVIFLILLGAVVVVLPFCAVDSSGGGGPEVGLRALRYDPELVSEDQFQPPSNLHWFGTDVHGRDLLARLISGARISLLVGLVGAGVALVIGVSWGAVAGYWGGRVDGFMMRVVDVVYSLPSIIFVIVLFTTMDSLVRGWFESHLGGLGERLAGSTSILFLFVGLGAVSWLTMARIVRGQVLSLRTSGFVEASRALGAGPFHILRRHIVPNVFGVIIVYLTLTVPAVILYESFLSYLGLGVQPPMASWGSLISEGAGQLNPIRIYWWLIVFPAGALVSTLVALNFLGDGLRDALNPRRT